MIIQTYRNGIGDIQAPDYTYWTSEQAEGTPRDVRYYFILSYIWIVWLGNQIFVLIVMLNFLIAVISQTYEEVMSTALIGRYQQMADLNEECRVIMSFLEENHQRLTWFDTMLQQFECLVIQFPDPQVSEESKGEAQWQGFVTSIKKFMINENKKQKLLNDKSMSIHHNRVDRKLDKIQVQMDTLREALLEIRKEIKQEKVTHTLISPADLHQNKPRAAMTPIKEQNDKNLVIQHIAEISIQEEKKDQVEIQNQDIFNNQSSLTSEEDSSSLNRQDTGKGEIDQIIEEYKDSDILLYTGIEDQQFVENVQQLQEVDELLDQQIENEEQVIENDVIVEEDAQAEEDGEDEQEDQEN